ncbi:MULTISPECIES: transposase domain-containing protein, partial [unclassified Ensifer]|uniref:transposase domain-containing protein n=1 Tax=unclassified Ensifer TaxID=2633371 RepID=UPI001FCDEDC3
TDLSLAPLRGKWKPSGRNTDASDNRPRLHRRHGQNERGIAMNRRNALFAGHDEGGRNWARFASLIGSCKMNGVEPYAYLRDLFISLANGHLAKDIDALMPWAYAHRRISASQ